MGATCRHCKGEIAGGHASRASFLEACFDANTSLVQIEATLEDARRIERDARARAIELRIHSEPAADRALATVGGALSRYLKVRAGPEA